VLVRDGGSGAKASTRDEKKQERSVIFKGVKKNLKREKKRRRIKRST
jgi:hypothetical protein